MNEASELVNRQDPLSFHKCQSCAFRTNSQHVILSHLEKHHLKSECKGFSCKSANLEVYKCQFCYLESDLKVAVCGHKSLVHGKTHCSDPEIELRSYICDKCGFETYSLLVFARHVCDDSQSEELSKSKFKYLLDEHICIYTPPEIWLQCEKCSYKTKKKAHLKSHIVRTHLSPNKINWFECEQCAYKTRRMIHLKGHILRKHMDPDEGKSSCQSKYPVELDDTNVHDELTDNGNIEEIQSTIDDYTTPAQSLRKNYSPCEISKRKNFKSVTNKTNQKLTSRGFNVPSSNRGTKKYFCIFCKRLAAKLPRHLEIMHKEEPEVQAISCLRKGSLERKNLIEKIRKKGIFEYNCSEDYNTERELIVSRRPQHNKGRIDRHYECCSNCHGFFSKLTLRHHFRKCVQNSRKDEGESICQSKYTVSDTVVDDINVHDNELTNDANIEENQFSTDIYTTPAQSLRKNSSCESSKNLKYNVTNRTKQMLTSRGFNVPSSIQGTKKYFCIFCKRLTAKLPRHLEIMHKEEPEVQAISYLRKGSLERKNLIEKIRKKGIFEYNCSEVYNTERELIVSRRPQHNKGRIDRHYECCSNCHGFFSKLTLRQHFRKCAQSSRKGERNIMITGRRARQIVNNNIASSELKNEVLPILRDDPITDAIRTDKLLLIFGNKMLKKNHAKYHHKIIRAHLRCLGRFLVAVKDKCTEINELADVYNVKYYDIIIFIINELAGLNHTSGKYKVLSYASTVSMLIKKVGNLLITECVKQKNYALKMIVKDFLKLFSTDYCKLVSKTVKENHLEIKRHKATELPILKISSKQNQENYNFESEFSQMDPFVKVVEHFNSEHNVNMESETTLIQNSLHTSYQPADNLEFDYNIVIVELEVDSQSDTTITGELEEFNSGSLTSINMTTPKGKKGKNKVAWSTHETKLLQERFAKYIKMRKLPPREECEQLINEHPFLKCRGRTVPKIKAWVSNYFRRLRLVKSNEM